MVKVKKRRGNSVSLSQKHLLVSSWASFNHRMRQYPIQNGSVTKAGRMRTPSGLGQSLACSPRLIASQRRPRARTCHTQIWKLLPLSCRS